MNSKSHPRPGGRSARVQAAVHHAVRCLIDQVGRAQLTVPMIAALAGVTPSTIYRRWGDLSDLLADVAINRMRPDNAPTETGTVLGDLQAWAEQYLEEMASDVGLSMLRDVLAGTSQGDISCQCAAYAASQVKVILERAIVSGDVAPEVDAVMDGIVAPIIFRALFGPTLPTQEHVRVLVENCVASATQGTSKLEKK
jgi:AcrR family transcriptional regulator